MQLLFQNPFWLLGALAAIPLLAHLFSRTRPRRREFPSVWLLREALRQVSRVRQPRDRWLLLLRTLAMTALALAFLQPLLLSRFADRSSEAKTAVLVVDASASMGYADGTRTRLAQAVAAAEDWLGTLPANSQANIIWVQARPISVLPEPGPNLEFLRQTLRQAAVRAEPGDTDGALTLALKQLSAAEGEKELAVVSDFQKTGWRGATWEMPPGVKLTRVAIGEEEGGNVGLAGLAVEPARPVAGKEARLICRVRNFSGEPRRFTVFAEAGESRLSQTVEISAWSETLAMIPVTFPQEGLAPLKVTLPEDRFPGDDVHYGVADVRGALQVGITGAEGDMTARTWARAGQALEGVALKRMESLSGEGSSADRLDVLFVADWKGDARETLTAHLKRGGALVVQPGEGLDGAMVRDWLGLPDGPAASQTLGSETRESPGWSVRITQEEHPIFALFASGAFGDPVAARFTRRISSPDFLPENPLLTFDDGRPALAVLDRDLGDARSVPIIWWNLDLSATDWPTRTPFLPFFGELLAHLAQRTGAPQARHFAPDELLRYDIGAALEARDVMLVDDRDRKLEVVPESARTPQRLVSKLAPGLGSYRWTAQGGVLDRAVVNFPESESDLRRLSPDELGAGAGMVIHNAGRARLGAMREGRPLWPWFLAAAAFLFLLEGVAVRMFFLSAADASPFSGERKPSPQKPPVVA